VTKQKILKFIVINLETNHQTKLEKKFFKNRDIFEPNQKHFFNYSSSLKTAMMFCLTLKSTKPTPTAKAIKHFWMQPKPNARL